MKRINKKLYYTWIVIIAIFLFILCIYYYFKYLLGLKNKYINSSAESFTTSMNYVPWSYQLQPFELDPVTVTHNNNYNKIWRGQETSDKDLVVNDIPIRIYQRILPFYNKLINADIGYVTEYYLHIPLVKFSKKIEKQLNDYDKNAPIINDDPFRAMNNKIWINRSNKYNPDEVVEFSFISSGNTNIDTMVLDFLNQFNKKTFEKDFNADNIHYSKFSLYKYRILQKVPIRIDAKKPNQLIDLYRILLILVSNTTELVPVIYLEVFIDNRDNRDNKVKYRKITTIGTYTTSELFLAEPGNILPENKYNYMNIDYHDKQKIVDNSGKKLIEMDNIITSKTKQFNLDEQYACFNADPNLFENIKYSDEPVLFSTSKKLCEARQDWYGRNKPYGIWDKPCKSDNECLFYESNQNYPNEYGKCNRETGYCELPLNMLHTGYHFYVQNENRKPQCYNCDTKEWRAITDLGYCCEEQKDKKKYPFLRSPDYAFRNDLNTRINYERLQKFMKPIFP
jgi:hypothetical protein